MKTKKATLKSKPKTKRAHFYSQSESLGGTEFHSGTIALETPTNVVFWVMWGHGGTAKTKQSAIRECRFIVNAFNAQYKNK